MEQRIVLVPLDGSPQGEAALPYALAVAKATVASVRLLTVIETDFHTPPLRRAESEAVRTHRRRAQAETYLTSHAGRFRAEGLAVTTEVVLGEPTPEILFAADAADVGMIVMATHARGGLQRLALGSVADKVMRLCNRPTLLVRPPATPEPASRVELRRLLVPLDGSPLAEAAIAPATELALATGSELLLVRVQPWLIPAMLPYDELAYTADLSDWEASAEAAAREYLDGLRSKFPAAIRVETFVQRGPVNLMLEEFVAAHRADLIVMSTHGRSGLGRFVLGSTADCLVRAGFPTLLIRPATIPSMEKGDHAQATGRLSGSGQQM